MVMLYFSKFCKMSSLLRIIPKWSRNCIHSNAPIQYIICRYHLKGSSLTHFGYNSHHYYSTENKNKSSVTEVKSKAVAPSTFEKVKENTKTASYLGVILVGLGLTGAMFYAIFRELFSSKSPNSVYTAALDRCCSDYRVINVLGEPIKGFGEETRRGRRRHVSHLFYQKDEILHLRMKFYIQGSRRRGTVHLEMKEDDKGKFIYRYLFVQMDDYPPGTIVLEDNRYDTVTESDKSFEV